MKSFVIFILICAFVVFCRGYTLENPVQLSALKSDFDELQECYINQEASVDIYLAISSKLQIQLTEQYVDITGGTIDLEKTYSETKTIKGTPLRYKNNNFYLNNKKQLDDFETYKINGFNPSATTTEIGSKYIVDYYNAEEFHELVQTAISNIEVHPKRVLDLNIYKIVLIFLVPRARYVTAYYNKDTNSVTIPSSFKILILDHIPLPGEALPNPVVQHGLVYDVQSKLFKYGYGLRNSEIPFNVKVFKLRPYPHCDEAQQAVSKFWERDRSLKISNAVFNNHAVNAISMGGTSLIKFDKNIQLTLKCDSKKSKCGLHGSFTIDGDDVREIISDKNKQFLYKSSSTGKLKNILQSRHVFLHPLHRKKINGVSNMKTGNEIEYIRISELRKPMYLFSNSFKKANLSPQAACSLNYVLNYRRIYMEYKCESEYFEIVKDPGLSVCLYQEDTLIDTLNIIDLEYNIRYSAQSDVFATRDIANGIYGFIVEDRIEFRDDDIASDLHEMAKFFDDIRLSLHLSESAKYYKTFAVMRVGTDEIFLAQLHPPKGIKINRLSPAGFMPWRTCSNPKPVMRIEGNFAFEKEDDKQPFKIFLHNGDEFLETDSQGNIEKNPNTGPMRFRFATESLLGTIQEKSIKKEIFYARVSDLQKLVEYIELKLEQDYCQNDGSGVYNVDIKIRENRDFIVEGRYSCRIKYFFIEMKPGTKIFTKDGKGVTVSELVRLGFMCNCVSITTKNEELKYIYAFRVKEYSEEHEKINYHTDGKKDVCTDRINGFKYSCFVKRDDSVPEQAMHPFSDFPPKAAKTKSK